MPRMVHWYASFDKTAQTRFSNQSHNEVPFDYHLTDVPDFVRRVRHWRDCRTRRPVLEQVGYLTRCHSERLLCRTGFDNRSPSRKPRSVPSLPTGVRLRCRATEEGVFRASVASGIRRPLRRCGAVPSKDDPLTRFPRQRRVVGRCRLTQPFSPSFERTELHKVARRCNAVAHMKLTAIFALTNWGLRIARQCVGLV
jgi:hypothetical protein